jgi:hypothetical protein
MHHLNDFRDDVSTARAILEGRDDRFTAFRNVPHELLDDELSTFNRKRSTTRGTPRATLSVPGFAVDLELSDRREGTRWEPDALDLYDIRETDERPRVTLDPSEVGELYWSDEIDPSVASRFVDWLCDAACALLERDLDDETDVGELVSRAQESLEVFCHPQHYDLESESESDRTFDPGVYYWHALPGCLPSDEPTPILEVDDLTDEIWRSA